MRWRSRELFEWVIFVLCPDSLIVPCLKEDMEVMQMEVVPLANVGNLFFFFQLESKKL